MAKQEEEGVNWIYSFDDMPSFFNKDNDYSTTDGSTLKWRELYKAMGPFQVSKTVMPDREDFTQMEQF